MFASRIEKGLSLIRRKIERIEVTALLKSLGKVAAASAVMTAAAYTALAWLPVDNRYALHAACIGVALIVFGACCKVLRGAEFGELLGVLRFGNRQG